MFIGHFSQLILAGVKTIEVRSYALGYRDIAEVGEDYWLAEVHGNRLSKECVLDNCPQVTPRPLQHQIVGTVRFAGSAQYESVPAFDNDRTHHRIAEGSKYGWDGCGRMHAWHVAAVRRLAQPVPLPGLMGGTGFKRRAFTVIFMEPTRLCPTCLRLI